MENIEVIVPTSQTPAHRHIRRELRFLTMCSMLSAVALVNGCTSFTGHPGSAGDAACAGTIEAPYGLGEVSDDASLLGRALAGPDKGGLCGGRVFRVLQPLTVYRVWDSSRPASKYGHWWSFSPPVGPIDAYRAKYGVCPAWSRLDRIAQCHLVKGATIVVGLGQSAQCDAVDANRRYPQTSTIQVYVPAYPIDVASPGIAECMDDVDWR